MKDMSKRKVRPDHVIGLAFLTAKDRNYTLTPVELKNIFESRLADDAEDQMSKRILATWHRLPTYIWCLTQNPRFDDGSPTCDIRTEKRGREVLSYRLMNPQVLNAKGHIKTKIEYAEDEIVAGLMDPNPNNDDDQARSESGWTIEPTIELELTDPNSNVSLVENVEITEVVELNPVIASVEVIEEDDEVMTIDALLDSEEAVESTPVIASVEVTEEAVDQASEEVVTEGVSVDSTEEVLELGQSDMSEFDDQSAEAIKTRNEKRSFAERMRAAKEAKKANAA